MSALGRKQTFAVQNGMSALPPKADALIATLVKSKLQSAGGPAKPGSPHDTFIHGRRTDVDDEW